MSLGLGSVIASALEFAPWLMFVGRHKTAVFIAVGLMLALNYWLAIVRPQRIDCAPGEACHVDSVTMRATRAMFWASAAIWIGAVVFTCAAWWWLRLQS